MTDKSSWGYSIDSISFVHIMLITHMPGHAPPSSETWSGERGRGTHWTVYPLVIKHGWQICELNGGFISWENHPQTGDCPLQYLITRWYIIYSIGFKIRNRQDLQ